MMVLFRICVQSLFKGAAQLPVSSGDTGLYLGVSVYSESYIISASSGGSEETVRLCRLI